MREDAGILAATETEEKDAQASAYNALLSDIERARDVLTKLQNKVEGNITVGNFIRKIRTFQRHTLQYPRGL